MQFKSFMEALKGDQHKLDKNKNGKLDAHDFKLLRKEEEDIEEGVDRVARADFKTTPSGRKSHKEITFKNDDAEVKKEEVELEERSMTDAEMKKREDYVKGMKKNISSFKDKYGVKAKDVMYATATKMAMKEESELDEALDPSEIAGNPKMYDSSTVKKAYYHKSTSASDKESLARHLDRHHGNKEWRKPVKEEAEQIDELSKGTLASYAKKATNSARITQSIGKDFEASANKSRKPGMKDAAQSLADKYKSKSRSREAGVGKAIDRLAKEEFELDEAMINGREYASHGLMHPDHAAHAVHKVTGNSVDFYAHGTGDKVEGKVIKNDGKAVHIKDTKGTTHKFKVQRGLPKQQNEAKDASEYDYEGEMAVTQLKTIVRHAEALQAKMKPDTNLPEWVQSKITLATDYIQTASDYLHSELEEQAPVAPTLDRKYIKGTPEHKAYKATKKPINGIPTNVKEETNQFDAEGNLMAEKLKFSDFIAKMNEQLLEYDSDDSGVYRHTKKATYGTSYQGDDDEDEKPKKPAADAPKRGRGRPAGSSGASYKPRSAETKAAAAAKAAATKAANKK